MLLKGHTRDWGTLVRTDGAKPAWRGQACVFKQASDASAADEAIIMYAIAMKQEHDTDGEHSIIRVRQE
jgi:hypothetical protein